MCQKNSEKLKCFRRKVFPCSAVHGEKLIIYLIAKLYAKPSNQKLSFNERTKEKRKTKIKLGSAQQKQKRTSEKANDEI